MSLSRACEGYLYGGSERFGAFAYKRFASNEEELTLGL